jgi:hypothetical protein
MKLARTLLMGFGSVALVAAFLILVAPKSAHAVVATLVQVANTSTNPVPNADVNAPGDEPFQTLICVAFPAGSFPCTSGTIPESFGVPTVTSDSLTVKRLVVENISGFCVVGGSQTIGLVTLEFSTIANSVNSINLASLAQMSTAIGATGFSHVSFPAPVYADPGSVVYVGAFNYGETPTPTNTAGCEYNIIGHLVTH